MMLVMMAPLVTPVVRIKRIELSAHVEQGALNLNLNFSDIGYGFKANTMHFFIMTESSQLSEDGGSLHSSVEGLMPCLGTPDHI